MSSVLIRGMEIPRDCYECKVWLECFDEKPPFNMIKSVCPLVEVKEPHGRLIDADKIDFRNYDMHDGKGNLIVDNNFINGIVWANDCIDRTPTVIEAEGSET